MKRILLFAVTALLLTACQESLEDRTKRALQDYSEKNCPIAISETLILDSCHFDIDSRTLYYDYHFIYKREDNSNIAELRKFLLDGLKNETSMRIYKEAGYNFMYSYYSPDVSEGKYFEIYLTKEDYQ